MVKRKAAEPTVVEYDGGLRLSQTALWLDAQRPVPLSFVSHVHAFRHHHRLVTSAQTLQLLGKKLGACDALASPWLRPFSLGELQLELIPAGSVAGSAQLLVRYRDRGLLYCAALRPGPAWLGEPCQVRPAEVLVLNCPYDGPEFVFPDRSRLARELVSWVGQVLEEGGQPVLVAQALGMAQEVCHVLTSAEVAVKVHRSVAEWNRLVRACGIPFGKTPELRQPLKGEAAVVAPAEQVDASWLQRWVPRGRVALVSGRAVLPEALAKVGAEVGFALSCHADSRALRQFVKDTGAEQVYLGPRHSAHFEKVLRRMGVKVVRFPAAMEESQLDLF